MTGAGPVQTDITNSSYSWWPQEPLSACDASNCATAMFTGTVVCVVNPLFEVRLLGEGAVCRTASNPPTPRPYR